MYLLYVNLHLHNWCGDEDFHDHVKIISQIQIVSERGRSQYHICAACLGVLK